jgi:hypothetical protein
MLSSSTEDEFLMIAEKLGHFGVRARSATASAENVALNISDIVALIQFHDITRQQFERSSRACRAMMQHLSCADDGKDGKTVAGETASLALAEDLARFCIYEAGAIEDTREQFVSAVVDLIGKFRAITEEVGRDAGEGLAAEIEAAVRGIRIHGFAHVVAKEVLSHLSDICAHVRQLVPAEAWERIAADDGPAGSRAGNNAAVIQKGIPPGTTNALGDNVELF